MIAFLLGLEEDHIIWQYFTTEKECQDFLKLEEELYLKVYTDKPLIKILTKHQSKDYPDYYKFYSYRKMGRKVKVYYENEYREKMRV